MKITDEQLKNLLVGSKFLDAEKYKNALAQAQKKQLPTEEYIVEVGLLSNREMGQVLANYFQFDYIDLEKVNIPEATLKIIPELVARNKGVILFSLEKNEAKIAMVEPDDLEVKQFIYKKTGLDVKPYFITRGDLKRALNQYHLSMESMFGGMLDELKQKNLSREAREKNVIKFVDLLLQYSHINKASDIHIDPQENAVVVRLRIDGILHDMFELPKDMTEYILTRIKILSKMRTDEHRAAQDGKLSFFTQKGGILGSLAGKKKTDVRVSVMPTAYGENVVMRILSSDNRSITLQDLGLSPADLQKIEDAIANPMGMILVTGPTGSGKTTTLYAMLKVLNKREVNITTIEDPIEYSIEGITQIQVNPKTELTFAKGLRGIVRQDPDIIMVGEIRDEETAKIAVNSAMTGHTVLSTLHTNNAATTLPRLLDMGIESFLVASTINIAIAQRLVRHICEKCRSSYLLTDEEKRLITIHPTILEYCKKKGYEKLETIRLYKGTGCKICNKTGYTGRMGIYEVLVMSEAVKDKILENASSDEIAEVAKAEGMTTMLEDGMEKVFRGETTLEEVLRVAGE
ncbi:MAG: GspE/PulE family protein [bacterium]|nr:GspE/PulE family protein [bacterium]